jgi:hypothetical protein
VTKDEQIRFVKNLTSAVTEEFVGYVEGGRVPSSWNGMEIKTWLAEQFDHEQMDQMRDRRKIWYRRYENAVLEYDL